jgi:hypothetical protein
MSDKNNSSSKSNTGGTSKQSQPSHYELSRAHAKSAIHRMAVKSGELAHHSTPTSKEGAAVRTGQIALAGGKDIGKSAYHAGMGFMEGVSKQNPNSGQQLNTMKIQQSITQGSQQAKQSTVNKGIEAARQKSSAKPASASKSTNKGIESYRSKANGQPSTASKSSGAGSSKGSSTGNGKSGGSSSGSSKGSSR